MIKQKTRRIGMDMFKVVALIDRDVLDLCAFVEGIAVSGIPADDPAYVHSEWYPVLSYVEHLHALPKLARGQYIDSKILIEFPPDVPVIVEKYDENSGIVRPCVLKRGYPIDRYGFVLESLGVERVEEIPAAYANALAIMRRAPGELDEEGYADFEYNLAEASRVCFVLHHLTERLARVDTELEAFNMETDSAISGLEDRVSAMLVKAFTCVAMPLELAQNEFDFHDEVTRVLRRISMGGIDLFSAELDLLNGAETYSCSKSKYLWRGIVKFANDNIVADEIKEPGEMRALLAKLVGGLWSVKAQFGLGNFCQGSEVSAKYYLSAIVLMAWSQVGGMRGNAVYKAFCTDFANVLKSKGGPEVWQVGFSGACFGDSYFQLK
jgi:hypothetical protein